MKSQALRPDRLEKLLRSLPTLDEQCYNAVALELLGSVPRESREGIAHCEHKAVIKDATSGAMLCATCALIWAKSHPVRYYSIDVVLRERCFFLAHPQYCEDCGDTKANRHCSYCGSALCYGCIFIVSTGAACESCSRLLEAQAEAEEDDDFDDGEDTDDDDEDTDGFAYDGEYFYG